MEGAWEFHHKLYSNLKYFYADANSNTYPGKIYISNFCIPKHSAVTHWMSCTRLNVEFAGQVVKYEESLGKPECARKT